MLGVALNAQRAGWGEQPFLVNITTDSVVSQALYQTPSFSWLNNEDYPPSVNNFNRWEYGTIDTAGYADLAGYNNNRWTFAITFRLHMPSGLTTNQGVKIDTKFTGSDGGFTSNWAWVHGYSATVRLQINAPFSGGIEMPATGYDAYNDQWLTVVSTSSDTTASYTNWTGTGTGAYYQRTAVYDTETAVLLGKTDEIDSQPRANISGYGNSVSSDQADADSVRLNGFSGGGEQIRQAGIWFSLGTMFDPLTETSDVWLTTRPGATIGNATAWLNSTATTYYENTGTNFYYMDEDTDIFTPDTADQRVEIANSDAGFTTGYSTTIIPKDQS